MMDIQDNLDNIQNLLEIKDYRVAWKQLKTFMNELAGTSEEEELKKAIRRYKFMLNLSRDENQTHLFCDQLMRKWEEDSWGYTDYIKQCRLLNQYLGEISNDLKLVIREMHKMHPLTAQHIIISVFEHFHQELVHTPPDDTERLLYFSFTYSLEANFETSISALNAVLKEWQVDVRNDRFKGNEIEVYHIEEDGIAEFSQKLIPIIRSIHFLEWIADEISEHTIRMEVSDTEICFFYTDFHEFRRYKLPTYRVQARKQNIQRTLPQFAAKRFNWKRREVNYERIIKEVGKNHFRLNIHDDEFFEAFKHAMEISYQTFLAIRDDTYIMNLDKLKCRGFNAFVLLIFYYCLMAMAIIYFEATHHYKKTRKKLPLAPYLRISNRDMGKLFIPILSKVTKQDLSQADIDKLLAFYNFGSDMLDDLHFKPVVTYKEHVVLVPSLFMMNNFATIFPHLLNKLKVNLDERGDTYEIVMRDRFKQNAFTVSKDQYPFNYVYEGNTHKGDIDIIARLGNYLFLGQCKNKLEPLDSKNQINVDRTIRKAIKQVKNTVMYIERNQQEFAKHLGISTEELATLNIQPFVLINSFYGSGQIIDNIPVIDTSAIDKYFDGEIRIHRGDDVLARRIRPEGAVQPQDFKDHLYSPYFLNPEVYSFSLISRHVEYIGDKKVVIGPERDSENFPNQSFITDAIAHFQEKYD
jgi:hypothetical protein